MQEFNLLEKAGLPQIKERSKIRTVPPEVKEAAKRMDFLFYDGNRKYGYGGYVYDGRWKAVAKTAAERYNLNKESKVLIDRCNKGFLVFDLKKLIPEITVYGIHPAEYALNHAMDGYGMWALANEEETGDPRIIEQRARDEITSFLIKGDSNNMPFRDNFFDTVISIENACAYPELQCRKVVREIVRVTKDNGKKSYIQNDSWRNESERQIFLKWTLLCKTFLDLEQWANLYKEENYEGDYGFTIIL